MKGKGSAPRRKALGRGLDALLANKAAAGKPAGAEAGEQVRLIPVRQIRPNPRQPRSTFRPEAIEELAQSIRADGVIQPVLVRPEADGYSLVAGERRWRAARLAGLEQIPAIVRPIDDDKLLEVALVENIQREDLNPIEVAEALEQLAHELALSHEELAQRTGKNRTTITNLLRLLKLPPDIQELVSTGRLAPGHARALLALDREEDQRRLAQLALSKGLSVRQVEQLVRDFQQPREKKSPPPPDPNVAAAVEELERALGTRVRLVQRRAGKGRIEIEYSSTEELDRIYALLTGED